jgi:hypothetical protein
MMNENSLSRVSFNSTKSRTRKRRRCQVPGLSRERGRELAKITALTSELLPNRVGGGDSGGGGDRVRSQIGILLGTILLYRGGRGRESKA